MFDDNSAPLFFMRSSLGFMRGGDVADKNFPQPNPTLAIPTDESATYGWENYHQVGKNGRPVQLNDEGDPYTDREGEASDIHQFARTQFESPATSSSSTSRRSC